MNEVAPHQEPLGKATVVLPDTAYWSFKIEER